MRAGRTPEPSGRRGWPAIATMFAHHAGRGLPRGRSHRPGAEPVRCRRARPRDPRRAGGRRPRAPDRRGVRWPDPVAVIGGALLGGGRGRAAATLWSGPITVDAWRFALNAADELPVKQCLPGPYTLGRRFAADEALGRQGQPRTESMPGTTQPHTTALIAHDGREGLADRVPSRNAEVVGVLIALVGESSAPAVWRGAPVSSTMLPSCLGLGRSVLARWGLRSLAISSGSLQRPASPYCPPRMIEFA